MATSSCQLRNMEYLTYEPEACRPVSLLDPDEVAMTDWWSSMEEVEGMKAGRVPTPGAIPMPPSAPLNISNRRMAQAPVTNDSAESAATMLGSSFEDPDRHLLASTVPTYSVYSAHDAPPVQWVPQDAQPAGWQQLQPVQRHSSMPSLPHAGQATAAHGWGYASFTNGTTHNSGMNGEYRKYDYAAAAPQQHQQTAENCLPCPLPKPMTATEFFEAMDTDCLPAGVAPTGPRSEGSTVRGGRSRSLRSVGSMDTMLHMEAAAEESEDEILRLDTTVGYGPGGALAPGTSTYVGGFHRLGDEDSGPPLGHGTAPLLFGGPKLQPPATPVPGSGIYGAPTNNNMFSSSLRNAVTSSPAGAHRGLALRGAPQLKRVGSATRRLASFSDGDGSFTETARPVRQAARRSMAIAAAAAAAEAWDEDSSANSVGLDGSAADGPASSFGTVDGYTSNGLVTPGGSVHNGGAFPMGGSATATPNINLGSATPAKKKHNPWSVEETRALVLGVRTIGPGKWAEIKRTAGSQVVELLASRSAVDLKDKWRNLTRVARLPRAQLKARLAKGAEVPLDLVLEVKELLDIGTHDSPSSMGS